MTSDDLFKKPVEKVRSKARKAGARAKVLAEQSKQVTEQTVGLTSQIIELFPHGITVGSTLGRPVLVLKDKATIEVLPVWMHPLDAGVALAELSSSSSSSPHSVTKRVLEMTGLTLDSCFFVEIIGHHQFVDLTFRAIDGKAEPKRLRVRADEAMSFCLQARARFYSTKEFMVRCRALDVDLTSLEQNLNEGQLPGLQAEMENSSKKHPYVM